MTLFPKGLSAAWAKLPGWAQDVLLVAALFLLGVGAALLFSGCASGTEYTVKINPATGEGTAVLHKVGLVEPLTGTGLTESEVTPPPEGGWGPIILGALAAVGGLQFAGPKSWPNWINIFKFGPSSSSWGSAGHSLAANLGIANTPKEAKSNETGMPVISKDGPRAS